MNESLEHMLAMQKLAANKNVVNHSPSSIIMDGQLLDSKSNNNIVELEDDTEYSSSPIHFIRQEEIQLLVNIQLEVAKRNKIESLDVKELEEYNLFLSSTSKIEYIISKKLIKEEISTWFDYLLVVSDVVKGMSKNPETNIEEEKDIQITRLVGIVGDYNKKYYIFTYDVISPDNLMVITSVSSMIGKTDENNRKSIPIKSLLLPSVKHDKVLIRIIPEVEYRESDGGIALINRFEETNNEGEKFRAIKYHRGQIIKVGKGIESSTLQFEVGEYVYIGFFAGTDVVYDNREYRICREFDIICKLPTLDNVTIDEMFFDYKS